MTPPAHRAARVEEIKTDLLVPWAELNSLQGPPHTQLDHKQSECPHAACRFHAAQGRLRDHAGFLLVELATRDAALAAARDLLDKMDAVHADGRYASVWGISQMHVGPYTGPKYDVEMETLRAALAPHAAPTKEEE